MKINHIIALLLTFTMNMNAAFAEGDTVTLVTPRAGPVVIPGTEALNLSELEKRRLQRALNVCYKYLWRGWYGGVSQELLRLKKQFEATDDPQYWQTLLTVGNAASHYITERVTPYIEDCRDYKFDHVTMTLSRVAPEDFVVDGKTGEERNVFIPAQMHSNPKDSEQPDENDPLVAKVRQMIESSGPLDTFVIP